MKKVMLPLVTLQMNNYRKVGLVFLIKHMILEDKLKACFLKTKALIQQKNILIKKIYWRVAQNWEIGPFRKERSIKIILSTPTRNPIIRTFTKSLFLNLST